MVDTTVMVSSFWIIYLIQPSSYYGVAFVPGLAAAHLPAYSTLDLHIPTLQRCCGMRIPPLNFIGVRYTREQVLHHH
jgi:hypothetical protein